MTNRAHELYKTTSWHDRATDTYYVGIERNGSLIMLDGVPGFEHMAGYSAQDSGTRAQRNADLAEMKKAAKILNDEFNKGRV